eukprot:TRINITY_DN6553_c0_g1_i13.p2 TRINITY_DN6553_c0_g1~~TRINITY_DN6553_c0_g1_i13.p2  ORF type:complete len:135 (+),score=44.44 TRINITY_DN6553_c0_g1_i13:928-1332(+)
MIFMEGGTTNGLYLLRFKRGAFENLTPIRPYFIEYYSPFCNPACDVFPMHFHVMFMCCQPFSTMTLNKLPVISFTDAVKVKVKDKSAGDVYAETVRDIYSKTFKLEKIESSLVDKVKLNDYVYRGGKLEVDKED